MKLKKLFWGVSLCVVCMFLLEHVAGIHINRELQNLSIESEGDIKRDDPTGSSKGDSNIDSNSSNNSSSSNSNNNNSDSTGPTEDSEDINNNDTQANGMANQSNEFEEFNNNSQKYSIFNGTFDFKNTRFEDGIAYDINSGLPILPDLNDKLENSYDFDDMPVLKEALKVEIGWIIIGICISLLVIMIITIITVSVIRHRRNRARRESEE